MQRQLFAYIPLAVRSGASHELAMSLQNTRLSCFPLVFQNLNIIAQLNAWACLRLD